MHKQISRVGTILAAIVTVATPAFAHFKLAKSEPAADAVLTAAPAKATVWFSQMPKPEGASITLEGPAGAVAVGTVEIGKDMSLSATFPKTMAPAKYTLTWAGAGDDGHVLNGKINFSLQATKSDASGTMPVAIRFAAAVGDKAFSCAEKYEGIGTTASAVQVTDFRFFASNVRLVRADGAEVPVALTQDGLWQNGGIALVDFEDATGTCTNGTPETRYVIEGTAPQGNYTGVRFALGLPFEVNHREVTLQASPLNLSRMFWNWNAGYKFMRLDIRSTGQPKGWMLHLGSTGCTPGDSPTVAPQSCKNANLAAIDVPYVAGRDVIKFDLKALLAESNVDANQEKTAMGCMSGPTDTECAPLFKQLGLAINEIPAGQQRVFSTRPATATMAAPR